MAFYPCFISFRHFGDSISEAFIRQFEECLTAELLPLVGEKPFIDFTRMGPGYSISASVAKALCESACMVVIWSPQYFSEEHFWCAMEFKAMMRIEKERLDMLPKDQRNKKLIIPVIYRGSKQYPRQVDDTLYLNFEKFALYSTEMIKNPFFADSIQKLAQYINERVAAFKNNDIRPWGNCDQFNLPSLEETVKYIKEVGLQIQNFPFR